VHESPADAVGREVSEGRQKAQQGDQRDTAERLGSRLNATSNTFDNISYANIAQDVKAKLGIE